MKFKMNKEGFTLLVSNMALGGAYFAVCEDKYNIPEKNREGEDMLEWTNELAREYEDNNYIELDDDEFVSVMTMVRSCLEACIEYEDNDIVEMLHHYVGIVVPFENRNGLAKKNIRYCFMLLEYLESIAPKGSRIQWDIEKKHIAKDRIDNLIERMEEG
tara:strand:- start:413 stop:889 length:477 start_codon:yes stop_codon:yes gene_type:complete